MSGKVAHVIFALIAVSPISSALKLRNSTTVACVPPWDGAKVIGKDGTNQCEWKVTNTPMIKGGTAPNMCLRQYADIVSDSVKIHGGWGDCPALGAWWESLPDRSSEMTCSHQFETCGTPHKGTGKLYVDVGTNIGACLVPMASRPDVGSAVSFEPNPANLFYVTNSLIANPTANSKVSLYPVALGDRSDTEPIFQEPGNAGNPVVGENTHANPSPVGEVVIRRLDDIFMLNGACAPYIHVMKLDAQGYEVKILAGAKNLFQSGAVNAVKFELATDWLMKQGTSSAEYMSTFIQLGYVICHTDSHSVVAQAELQSVACGPPTVQDFVAVRLRKGEAQVQMPVVC